MAGKKASFLQFHLWAKLLPSSPPSFFVHLIKILSLNLVFMRKGSPRPIYNNNLTLILDQLISTKKFKTNRPTWARLRYGLGRSSLRIVGKIDEPQFHFEVHCLCKPSLSSRFSWLYLAGLQPCSR